MDTTSDKQQLFDSALSLMMVRLVVYANAMEARNREHMDKAERCVKRSIQLAYKHDHDVAKLLDTASCKIIEDGASEKIRNNLGFIVYDMKVAEGIITKADNNIS